MKRVVFTLLIVASLISLRADILVNGNFADGRAHWKGDAQPLDQSDLSSPSTTAGVTITLKKDKWTKIYQFFTSKERKLRYSITFKLSDDYNVDQDTSPNSSDSISFRTPGLDDIEGMFPFFLSARGGRWVLIPYEAGAGWSDVYLSPDTKKSDSQTLTGEIRGFNDNNGTNERLFLLAFPPGEGTITLSNITLEPITSQ